MEASKQHETLKRLVKAQQEVRNLAMRIVQTDPWVPVLIGGIERRVEYSWGAVKQAFRETGIVVNNGELDMSQLSNYDLLSKLLLIGLRHGTGAPFIEMTQETFDDLLNMKHMEYYKACLMSAIDATQPDLGEVQRIMGEIELPEDRQESLPLGE